MEYLTFFVAGQEHAVDAMRVRGVLSPARLAEAPGGPAWLRGKIELDAEDVAVVDLAAASGIGRVRLGHASRILVVGPSGEHSALGVLADAVGEAVEIPAGAAQLPPPFSPRVRAEHVVGIGRLDERLLLLVDADKLPAPSGTREA